MRFDKCALLCALLALSILEPIVARKNYGRGGGHSYPKSGGLSGGGHSGGHGYPSSGGLSGGGGHGYPSSGGLSGGRTGGGHGYPSTGNSNPSSGGSHGYPSSGGSSGGGGHGYPASGGLSGSGSSNTHHTGTHGYPANKGLGGNTGSTNVHYHYHYNPPQQIRYAPVHGGAAVSYPVYRGAPPTYVYQYKDSGSKYGTLLAGLALLNLGALAGTAAYAASSHGHSNSYKAQPGEICKFGVKKDNGDYEETKIDCQLITSFILQDQANTQNRPQNTTVTTTTVTNVTMVNMTNPAPGAPVVIENVMLPNGTLVPMNVTLTNATSDGSAGNSATSSVTTITTTNSTTVTNALDVKGKPIEVTPSMQCYVIRHTPSTNMRKSVPCGLLQTYADRSLKRNSAARNAPAFTILAVVLAAFVMS